MATWRIGHLGDFAIGQVASLLLGLAANRVMALSFISSSPLVSLPMLC